MNQTELDLRSAILSSSDGAGRAAEATLTTSERVLARITDGIYRQPASALRELISNAYDADATSVVILSDAPRFSSITVRDNGSGLSPGSLAHMVLNIGGSAKRTREGSDLAITSKDDPSRSPKGRVLIGKLGIGLFAVSQFTHHFFIVTKTEGDRFRTIADITLGPVTDDARSAAYDHRQSPEIEAGHARIFREAVSEEDLGSHGTEVKLVELLPRTRAELASEDLWARIDYETAADGSGTTRPPEFHIGRVSAGDRDRLAVAPALPWADADPPELRFRKLVDGVRELAELRAELVDLDVVCDRYLQTIWTLSLAAPLPYIDGHPFDMSARDGAEPFLLGNAKSGQASRIRLRAGRTIRSELRLRSPDTRPGDEFRVEFDGVGLARPLVFREQPRTASAVKNPLLFLGKCREGFDGKPPELTGGALDFEAYLFWTPKVVPTQHQGVLIRTGNASGAGFDRTFMGYQVSEQTRLRQITAEIFVREGLDGAINIDRESFNFAHPHYQYLTKWLHSALRQLANKHKEVGSAARAARLQEAGRKGRAELEETLAAMLAQRGVEDLPEVVFLGPGEDARAHRREGKLALSRERIVPRQTTKRNTLAAQQREAALQSKIEAVARILESWGVLRGLTHAEQEVLLREIASVIAFEPGGQG